MKLIQYLCITIIILGCSSTEYAGTATDVNSGSLSGLIEASSIQYREELDVTLYNENGSIVQQKTVLSGEYEFNGLKNGKYSLSITTKESVILNENKPFEFLDHSKRNIPVNRIVEKSFELYSTEHQLLTVNSFDVNNMRVEELRMNQFQVTCVENDTTNSLRINYELNGVPGTCDAVLQKHSISNYEIKLIENTDLGLINRETILLTGTGNDSSTILIDGIIK